MEEIQLKTKALPIFDILRSALLIAGTCIGGGMLALPLSIGVFGFFPSVLLMFLSCGFMAASSLLYLEATLWMKEGGHVNTLSNVLLSKTWRIVCIVVFVFICYASIIAYLSWGGKEFAHTLNLINFFNISDNVGIYLFTAIFGLILCVGYKFLGRVNSILFFGIIFSYVLLIFSGSNEIQWNHLKRESWSYGLFFTSPLMLAIFSFPGIVPSITHQLNKDARSVKLSILIGMLVTLLVYVVWIFFVLGSIPYEGTFGLMDACAKDIPISQCIHFFTNSPWVSVYVKFFTFFAIATSFLGISLSLFDFFFDAFRPKERKLSTEIAISSLVVLPSLVITLLFEKVFVTALEISGGFGDAILSGLIPVLMIWNGRYKKKFQGDYTFPGGKPLLITILAIASLVFISEFITLFFR